MKEDPVVFIKELSEQDRPFMLNHFLGLSPADRRLRFGAALPDEAVTKYVNAIDFNRDTIFGVYESTFNLVGVGHLAFPLPENLPPSEDVQPNRVAEFGVSVSAPMRRKNVGTKLFDRAAIHCRNTACCRLAARWLTMKTVRSPGRAARAFRRAASVA